VKNVNKRIDQLEKQISELRLIVLQQAPAKTTVSFKGALKGAKISEADIRQAKKSLFPHARAK
jgi:hypothetical protein